MIYTKKDIVKLLRKGNPDELNELASLLKLEISSPTAQELADKMWWTFQTPLGYLTRDPAFDEICLKVAKKLKLSGLTRKEGTSWELLEGIIMALWKKMINEMTDEQKQNFARELFSDPDFKKAAEREGFKWGKEGFDWGKVSAGTILLGIKKFGGFATYKVAVIVANQVARALLGRGLAFATNAALCRAISVVLGPVGWLLLLWGINDLLGTNFKKVIPATLYLYCIYDRLKVENDLPPGF